jgi:hypothetical protein
MDTKEIRDKNGKKDGRYAICQDKEPARHRRHRTVAAGIVTPPEGMGRLLFRG